MSEKWSRATLEELCIIGDGNHSSKYPKKSEMVSDGVPFIRSTNLVDGQISTEDILYISEEKHQELKKGHLRVNDVLFTNRGEIGKVAIVDDVFDGANLNSQIAWLRCQDGLLPKYLFFFLQSDKMLRHFSQEKSGAALQQFTIKMIKEVIILYPQFDEQRRIVAIVDQAFEAIDVAIENTKQNLANARELFESYLNDIFDRKGDGWEDMTIGEIADHSFGKMLDARKNKGVLKPYLRNFNVRWFEFDLSDVLEMPFEESEREKYTATKGDVLICEGGYPGRAAIWQEDEPIYFQKAIHRVRFQEPTHSKWFLYFIYSSDCNGNLKKHFTGTGIQHFTGQSLHGFKIPIPPVSTVERFVLQFDRLRQETQRLEAIYRQKLAALTELKQSILQKAFTGELTADQEAP
jgi:type I restriction enzyme, S subunit